MLICLSARYIEQELALHYGKLPPGFLPIGGERLFAAQARSFRADERCILTLPEDFEIAEGDRKALEDSAFEVLRISSQLSLTAAITEVLAQVKDAVGPEPVRLLFGDTLVEFENLPADISDFVAVKPTRIDYPWTYGEHSDGTVRFFEDDTQHSDNSQVVCGYFSFSDFELLQDAFLQPSLAEALNAYAAQKPLDLVKASIWHDFGHLALFYQSKRDLLVARAFNSLDADEYVITKTSRQTAKMQAEAAWFENIPQQILLHTPRYVGRKNKDNKAGYQLEYLHLPTLSDMAVFGRLPQSTMNLILSRCVKLIDMFRQFQPDPAAPEYAPEYAQRFYDEIIQRKTWSRLEAFCTSFGCTLDTEFSLNGQPRPSLRAIVEAALAQIPPTRPEDISLWHGDLFFGNLLFDFNTQRVVMVDPRGMLFDNVITQYGDYRYDVGKLAHSVLGGYDHIIANQALCTRQGPHALELSLPSYPEADRRFATAQLCQFTEDKFGIGEQALHALALIMFFSMLPLHQENPARQAALFANGLRLSTTLI